jgi:hypothetical protein
MNSDTVLSVVGIALVGVGFAMMVVPGLAGVFQTNELYVTLIGIGFALQTARIANSRRRNPYEQAETADPEIAQDLPTPGEEFDELLAEAGANRKNKRQRETVRERLEAAAVAVIVRRDGVSREAALEQLETGEWTDDPYAAAFFTGRVEGASFVERVSLFDRSRSQYERWSTHAAREIIRLDEEAAS